jgi:hypothetical protein
MPNPTPTPTFAVNVPVTHSVDISNAGEFGYALMRPSIENTLEVAGELVSTNVNTTLVGSTQVVRSPLGNSVSVGT